MFSAIASFFGFSKKKCNISIVGLDNSGKTTLLSHLKPIQTRGDVHEVVPTVGFQVEKFSKANLSFTCYDMSGQSTYRGLWESYYSEIEAVVFVLDSSDKLRMVLARDELQMLLQHEQVAGRQLPILVFANKMDIAGSLTPVECMGLMELDKIVDKPWHIAASNALSGDGIDDGFQWLAETIQKVQNSKNGGGSKRRK